MVKYQFLQEVLLALLVYSFKISKSQKFSCLLLDKAECSSSTASCVWNDSFGACQHSPNSQEEQHKWNGFIELAQTHVVHGTNETRHAPRIVAERETELLFTPTFEEQSTPSPTPAPTPAIVHEWGLEQEAKIQVNPLNPEDGWPQGFPRNVESFLTEGSSVYYTPNSRPDIDINFDLEGERKIQGIYIKSWYVTRIKSIDIGIHPDNFDEETPAGGEEQNVCGIIPDSASAQWVWFNDVESVSRGYNKKITINIPKVMGRFIKIRIHNGSSSYGGNWGIRHIQISGIPDGLVDDEPTNEEDFGFINKTTFIPSYENEVRVSGYSPGGRLLGVLRARDPTNIRPILEQSITDVTLDPYSAEAWSATLPWNWIQEGTEIFIGVESGQQGFVLLHKIVLRNIAFWARHTLVRANVLIFGTEEDVSRLNTKTTPAKKLATGMFGIMPTTQIHWVDTANWHLPYLVQGTSNGPVLVHSETERIAALKAAGDDPKKYGSNDGEFPGWDILKNQLALRHTNANSGRGLSVTNGDGGSEYASGTSIFMGWSFSDYNPRLDRLNEWRRMGQWSGWGAAAWVGWCGMRPHDECGNYLSHELGHSQTMHHFTSGTAVKWGIEDEYPLDGTNLATHPWGYDTCSRQFRTWYYPPKESMDEVLVGKRDPMNGGKLITPDSCFLQYTAYHAKKSQNWAKRSAVLIPAGVSGVSEDGAFRFDKNTGKYKRIPNGDITSAVDIHAAPPDEVGVPIVTLIGTLGASKDTCQTYPPLRSSEGNTFLVPGPLDPNLSTQFSGSAYFLEVQFEGGSSKRALIATPTVVGSKMRYYSFNIAASRRPISADLYHYDTDSYPNITPESSATLLHSRPIELPPEDAGLLAGLEAPLRVGRGWLGDSGDVKIKKLCVDCQSQWKEIRWRGNEDVDLSYVPDTLQPLSPSLDPRATTFQVPVVRSVDGTEYTMTVFASRFMGEGGDSVPLTEHFPQDAIVSPDVTHGVRFWATTEHNYLPGGTYRSVTDALTIRATRPNGEVFANLRVSVEFTKTTEQPSSSPSSAPSPSPVDEDWGLEQFGTFDVVPANGAMGWPKGWPKNKKEIIRDGSEYYLPLNRPDVNIDFDLRGRRYLEKVYIKTWFKSRMASIDVGIHPDDENINAGELPTPESSQWKWFDAVSVKSGYNVAITFDIPTQTFVRYVKIRLRGGYTDFSSIAKWGLRTIKMYGSSSVPTIPTPSLPTLLLNADLSNGAVFLSRKIYAPDSSAYFINTNSNIGPTSKEWWGGAKSMLHLPLTSSCGDTTATVKAQQIACGSTWQMNAGRTKNFCGHSLSLQLEDAALSKESSRWHGCTFTTSTPVVFEARRFHEPDENELLAKLSVHVQVKFGPVSCGDHFAHSCSDCPLKFGALSCKGNCQWDEGQCIPQKK